MTVEKVEIGEPFFGLDAVTDEAAHRVAGRAIVLNLGTAALKIEEQALPALRSVIVQDATLQGVEFAIVIHRFDAHADEDRMMRDIRARWPSAFDVRGEERLRGIEHFMSPKVWVGQTGLTIYHSASVPLNVGLHKDHPFCPVPGFREVHTQIAGLGKMQQCRKKSVDTLYLEEVMAPGVTHTPMFDADGNYPWHQFETITPSVFLAVEMLPDGAPVPVGGPGL